MKKSTIDTIDNLDADNGVIGNISLFVKKIKKNVNNPNKWLWLMKLAIGKVISTLYFFVRPLSRIVRLYLLNKPSRDVIVVDICKKDLNKVKYDDVKRVLANINKSIDWSSKKNEPVDDKRLKVSIIVLVLNNISMTKRCIDSIYKSKNVTDFELIVIDNGSSTSTVVGLRSYKSKYPKMKLIHSTNNMNFALGNNVGFSYSQGEIVVFLNNDTYVTDWWLDRLIRPLEDSNIKAVQPALFYPDNKIQCVGVAFSNRSSLGYGIYVGKSINNKNAVKSRRLQAVTGACMAVRSADFAQLNGFDPVFINGQEDIDLCLRLTKNNDGYCYCESSSIVFHDEGKTKGRGRYVLQNRREFLNRWFDLIKSDDAAIYKNDGYEIVDWTRDSDEAVSEGLCIFIPTLKYRKKRK